MRLPQIWIYAPVMRANPDAVLFAFDRTDTK